MSYHRGGLPPEFVPPPIVEPLTAVKFVSLLDNYINARKVGGMPTAHAELLAAVEELFRRLAT